MESEEERRLITRSEYLTLFGVVIFHYLADNTTLNRLADAMFGDDSDDDAKGAKKEFKFKPCASRQSTSGGESDGDDDEDEEGNDNSEDGE